MEIHSFYLFSIIACIFSQIVSSNGVVKTEDCVCGTRPSADVKQRIVGGEETVDHDFPWMVALQTFGALHCGGSLISHWHVLTAGHCLQWTNKHTISVVLGMHNWQNRTGVLTRRISQAIIHEDFASNPLQDNNDIAILTLNEEVPYNDNIRPICLPAKHTDYTSKMTTLTGWGKLADGGISSDVLMGVNLKVMSDKECRGISNMTEYITSGMLCAIASGKDGCQGDSGGPLIYESTPGKWEQVGIVSWGFGCAVPGMPGVYSIVSYFMDWIESKLGDTVLCKG